MLATGSFDHTARLWSIAPRKTPVRRVLKGHRGVVMTVIKVSSFTTSPVWFEDMFKYTCRIPVNESV